MNLLMAVTYPGFRAQDGPTEALKTPDDASSDHSMSSGENTGGLMSSAGLVRYFDSEDRRALEMDPKTVIAGSVALGLFIQLLNFSY